MNACRSGFVAMTVDWKKRKKTELRQWFAVSSVEKHY